MAMSVPQPLPRRFVAARWSPLVGRAAELRSLEAVWAEVEAGGAQAVLIGGEPGAGKTRLAAEIAGVLSDNGVTVLVAAATKDAGVPYQPFVEILDRLFEAGEPAAISELVAGAPFDLGRLSARAARHLPAGAVDGSSDLRLDLFDAFAALLRGLSRSGPVVVVLDDLHWATMPTVALFEHLVHSCTDTQSLFVATFRTTAPDRSWELSERLANLYRLDGVHRIDLTGLDTEAIAAFVGEQGGASASAARGDRMPHAGRRHRRFRVFTGAAAGAKT